LAHTRPRAFWLSRAIFMRRPGVLDIPPTLPGTVHDLHSVAPEAVFAVRTCRTRALYGPGLVRNFSHRERQTRRPATRGIDQIQIVAQDIPGI
jgi:hypothetical protein